MYSKGNTPKCWPDRGGVDNCVVKVKLFIVSHSHLLLSNECKIIAIKESLGVGK